MAICGFFKMAAIRNLRFVGRVDTHKEYLVVFIVLQNFIGIGNVVLKICEFQTFNVLRVWLENACSHPFWGLEVK